jgi:hypothetical protein
MAGFPRLAPGLHALRGCFRQFDYRSTLNIGDHAEVTTGSMQRTFEAGGYRLDDRGARWIESYVRLKPGVSRAQAQQQISAIAKPIVCLSIGVQEDLQRM